MARVVIKHLTKTFEPSKGEVIHALTDFELAVESGELLVLLGPSGSGKTTTLRLIAGLEEPTSGTISIDGKDVTRVPPRDRDVAMVFQHPALYPHMTVFENMAFGLSLRKVPRSEIETRVGEMARLFELENRLDHKPAQLAGGEKQRVALGRALVRQPKLLLLDEPLSSLDPQLRSQLRSVIARLNRSFACTMIYVTHDQTEGMMLGTRLGVIKDGVMQQIGEPLEVYRKPVNMFIARFVGSPTMNLVAGTLVQSQTGLCFEASSSQEGDHKFGFHVDPDLFLDPHKQTGRRVVFGIRPEHIGNGPFQGPASFEGVVQLVETAGSESYVHLRYGQASFVSRATSSDRPAINQKRVMNFNLREAHFFDALTGEAIT